MSSLMNVREYLALKLTNDDGSYKNIRSNLNIFSSWLKESNVDKDVIINGDLKEKELLMRRIAAFMSIGDQIRMTFNFTKDHYGMLKCSRYGTPAPEKNAPSQHCRSSMSCECKASLKLSYITGDMTFNDHSDLCREKKEPLSISKSHPTTIENLISPDKRLAVVTRIAIEKTQDQSLKKFQLLRKVPDNMQHISKKIVQSAINESRGNISATLSFNQLIEELNANK